MFAIVAAFLVVQRFNAETLSLIVGLALGALLLALPVVAIAWVYVKIKTARPQRPQGYTVPPVIIQQPNPQALPYGQDWDGWQVPRRRRAREFEVVE